MSIHDVIVIGGGYAGIAAALQLGRARRDVVVIDGGAQRNRTTAHAHGFLGFDGVPPGEIAARGRADLAAYPTVAWRRGHADRARAIDGGFAVRVDDDELTARRLILATGVVDELPALPGLAERWGRHVFHCPYCHGYELDRGRIGVLASGPLSLHQVALVAEWSTPGGTTLFLDGAFEPDAAQLADLAARGIGVERARVAALEGDGDGVDLRLVDGRVVAVAGLFIAARTRIATPFAAQLGCALEDGPLGAYLRTGPTKETTVAGVFAAGDAALMAGAIAIAVAEGVMAGIGAHRSLVFPDGV